jgi:hypothetical protein
MWASANKFVTRLCPFFVPRGDSAEEKVRKAFTRESDGLKAQLAQKDGELNEYVSISISTAHGSHALMSQSCSM